MLEFYFRFAILSHKVLWDDCGLVVLYNPTTFFRLLSIQARVISIYHISNVASAAILDF